MPDMKQYLRLLIFLGLNLAASDSTGNGDRFVYSGFTSANLTLDGTATVTATGLLELTDSTPNVKSHAFHPAPLRLREPSNGTVVQSFSVSFMFAILSPYPEVSAHGMAFLVAPSINFSGALPAQYLGLLNAKNNGNASSRIFAVELDTIQNDEFHDISANHVGIDINSLSSVQSSNAGYYDDGNGSFHSMTLMSQDAMQVWVDYDAEATQINVTLAPIGKAKPIRPLVSATYDLSMVIKDVVYVGFSSATGEADSRHYVLGWSVGVNSAAPAIDITKLPQDPVRAQGEHWPI